MRAIDEQIVLHQPGGGRYVAARSAAREVLFWEGLRHVFPRPITLWLEPVITFAALARLHLNNSWPRELLGMQSKGWGFDVAAYPPDPASGPFVLGEVKKSGKELRLLRDHFLALAGGAPLEGVPQNSRRKWQELDAVRPAFVWLLGPDEDQFVFEVAPAESCLQLRPTPASALACPFI